MDVTVITQLIANLGFPIACCVAMFYHMNKQTEQHREEMEKVTAALNNNTLALNRLEMKIGEDENGRT